jgi:putative DNA methylase
MNSGEIVTRGKLPHWYVPGAAHFVTYRLAGTLPGHVLESLRARKTELLQKPLPEGMTPAQRRVLVHKQLFGDYEKALDGDRSIDWLARPAVAALIRGNLYHHHGKKYNLLAYCVMPNHGHVLFVPNEPSCQSAPGDDDCGERPDAGSPLSAIMHSLKSYTANRANALLGRCGPFWQHESYDHWVRDEDELERIVDYIRHNPVRAKLVTRPQDWFFCSAHDRYLHDGSDCGFLPP